MLEAVIFTLAVMFSDGCLGAPEPGEGCLAVNVPGSYSVLVRDEAGQRSVFERRCADDNSIPCHERLVPGITAVR
jgi:hypothetical protein